MDTPRRGHFLVIFHKASVFSILLGSLYLLVTIITGDISTNDIFPLLILWSSFIVNAVKYFNTTFHVSSDTLIIQTGLFTKRKIEMPLRNITTIDLSQDLLARIFRVYKVKVDNGSQSGNTVNSSEFTVILKTEHAYELKNVLSEYIEAPSVADEASEATPFISAKPSDFVKLGLMQSKIRFLVLIPVIVGSVVSLFSFISAKHVANEDYFISLLEGELAAVIISLLILSVLLLPLVFSVLSSIFVYWNYKVTKNARNIIVEYGLIKKQKYTLQLDKINGIVLNQNLLMQLFGFYSVEARIIGYGDKNDEQNYAQSLLFPIAKLEKAQWIINTLLPEFDVNFVLEKSPKKAYRYYFFRPLPFIFFAMAILFFAFTLWVPGIIVLSVMILMAVSSILQIRNTGISFCKKTLIMVGGGYHKHISFIRLTSIENISAHHGLFKRRRNIADIKIGYIGPKNLCNIEVKNLDDENFRKLERVVEY